jgi:creatinine amidohydrolase
MTSYFAYEDLTWPEVAALPRDTPLIIPLGNGYSLDLLASALGQPPEAGLLPAIPYGWRGSGLTVDEAILGPMTSNLVTSLRDDGFTQVFILTPQGVDLALGQAQIVLPHSSQFSSPIQLPEDHERSKVVLIPIGHTEQHGFHLPLSTDTLIIEAVSQGVAAMESREACTLPVMPYGVSTHRQAFAGTLNTGGRAFENFWLGVIDRLVGRGFERFYFMSGHGGNCSFLVTVVKYAGEQYRGIFCATSWLYLSGPEGIAALSQHRKSKLGGMGHAGELETALILHLRPDLVHMDRVIDETDFIATPSYYMDWAEGGTLVANPPWDDDTRTGAYGAGSLATRENGECWLAAAIAEKVTHVTEIQGQQERRTARRERGFGLWGERLKTELPAE